MFFGVNRKKENGSSRNFRKRKNFFEKKGEAPKNSFFLRFIHRILVFFFFALIIYVLFFSPFLEIKEISLTGVVELDYDSVYRKISEISEEKYFNFIPKKNLILFPNAEIKRKLADNFKKISEVKVKKVFPDWIKIEIDERKNILIWCSGGPCYIIDDAGNAYVGIDFESEEAKQNNLINVIDVSAKPVIMKEKILDKNYIVFIVSLKEELEKELDIKIIREFQTQSRIAGEIKISTEEGWKIYFSSGLPVEGSILTLKTFLAKEINPEEREKLEYVDLRAENKVYYKFKDEQEQKLEEPDKSE